MPTYFNNWPQGYEALPDGEVQKSRDAGAAVIRAIAASMRLLLGYESPDEWRPEAAKEAAEHFSNAAA